MTDITDKWSEYESVVLEGNADGFPVMRLCELAFLAGAQAMIKVLGDMVTEHESFDVCEELFERQQVLIQRRSNEILSD